MTLSAENLSFAFHDSQILNGISFESKPGEFIGLIGPNGAGKTTLLKCLIGIYKSRGNILLDGRPLSRMSEKQIALHIAMMHQNTAIAYPFPALEIVLMGRFPHQKRMSESPDDYRIARECMEYTDTLQFEKKTVTAISGGERQRVFFAKVMAQKTDILLLDEPTASLDISHQEQIFKYASALCRDGKTVIAAVHDLKIAARYCNRLLLLKDGSLLTDGECDSVLTSDLISSAYGVNAIVYRNEATGLLDFFISETPDDIQVGRRGKVHVVCGGGCASGVMRYLFGKGYEISAGVLTAGDSDLKCAEVFRAKAVTAPPFAHWDDETCARNIEHIKNAPVTVLCGIPFGPLNIENLRMLDAANKLIIIEDDPISTRDFTGGEASSLYSALIKEKHPVIIPSARLHEVL